MSQDNEEIDEPWSHVRNAASQFERRAKFPLAILDLQKVLERLEADRDHVDIKSYVSEIAVSSRRKRFADLCKAILEHAFNKAAWEAPSRGAPFTVSLQPSQDDNVRHATRVLAMVHELHKVGFQRIRIFPYQHDSTNWRCAITTTSSVPAEGFSMDQDEVCDEDGAPAFVAHYSSADGSKYFSIAHSDLMDARELAKHFIEQYPDVATAGKGQDWLYVGWLTSVLGVAEAGYLPILANYAQGPVVLPVRMVTLPPNAPFSAD